MTSTRPDPTHAISTLPAALQQAGFRGEAETDTALRAAMSTDNSVYCIRPDIIIAPRDATDVVTAMRVLEKPPFAALPVTARGGGTGTNGQSLNTGVIFDMRRHMNRLLAVDPAGQWADVEPGIVLDDLNAQLRSHGVFFAPETSTSTRCTLGGMVSTDASGKGSRVYGKTSDNLVGLEIARGKGLLNSLEAAPDWAAPMLATAEQAARSGRTAFVAATPNLNRRFTGYDLDRACPEEGSFDWWRLFPGSEGTLGPITRIRVKLQPLAKEKRLVVAAFATFRDSLGAGVPLLADDPTAIEVMDERVTTLAEDAGLLERLPDALRPASGTVPAYTFVEFNGDDVSVLEARIASCEARLRSLPGIRTVHVAADLAEIRELWAIRSAGVGLLGKVDGNARPVAFVEDCVVSPEALPAFLDGFLDILARYELGFGIYGHVDAGCLHIRPALDIDSEADRMRLVLVSNEIFALTNAHGGIFWGEHGKGVRGAYLESWIGPEAYRALQGVKAAFDPSGRFNPGKLVSNNAPVMGIATTPFRAFNAPEGDSLDKAFRCNGNAQCLSYAAATPMCPSFKATGDLRHSPKGRADALRAWHDGRRSGQPTINEDDLLGVLDTCLGCKACASTCPVQVDIPAMRAAFLADYHQRHRRPLTDRLMLLAERLSPWMLRAAPLLRPVWSLVARLAGALMALEDLPDRIAPPPPRAHRIRVADLTQGGLPEGAVLVWMDWFSALFDAAAQADVLRGLRALGYHPLFVEMRPTGKLAADMGDRAGFDRMADRMQAALQAGAATGAPMIGLDPAFVMALRQDYPRMERHLPPLLLPQEFLAAEVAAGRSFPQATGRATVLAHCTEATGTPTARADWSTVFTAIGLEIDTPATGCCGMAGLFGHKRRHGEVSRRLFDLSWAGPLASSPDAAATGFSCRCQSERLSDRPLPHPLGLIADRIGDSRAHPS